MSNPSTNTAPPSPNSMLVIAPWEALQQVNLQRLLWLLSHLLERQLEPSSATEKEDGGERDKRSE